MKPRTLGEDLFARGADGRLLSRIATAFPRTGMIVTLPGTHGTQRVAFTDDLNRRRREAGQPALSDDELEQHWLSAVDLIIDENETVLIRPDPCDTPLAFEADEMLQGFISKRNIRFLHILNPRVRESLRRRGERWRFSPLPRSGEEMRQMINGSKIAVGGRPIYYYSQSTGTRILTCFEFQALGRLDDEELRRHLIEIGTLCQGTNRYGNPEIDFFMAPRQALARALHRDFSAVGPIELRALHREITQLFCASVPNGLCRDEIGNATWRSQMYAALLGQSDTAVSEEALLGLGDEFFMQVQWKPGGRIEDGELIIDPLFDEEARNPNLPADQRLCDEIARGFIFNFIRDYGDLEYVNIGRVVGSLCDRKRTPGRRGVYVAEIKRRDRLQPILRILRMQKWGVAEHLDENKTLLDSILESEGYTEYILDRRLGCRQLGMNLCARTAARKVRERYAAPGRKHEGQIYSAYFERDYIPGVATDKIPRASASEPEYALGLARVLGRAAAPNLIVGRCDYEYETIFDDGDELVIEDDHGIPMSIVVADHTGTFQAYRHDLKALAPHYARIVTKRDWLPDPAAFLEEFLRTFVARFQQIQQDYRKRYRAFDTLFKHLSDEEGAFGCRWACVLKRLAAADPLELADCIRKAANLPTATAKA